LKSLISLVKMKIPLINLLLAKGARRLKKRRAMICRNLL
jgi:hypothetical protein